MRRCVPVFLCSLALACGQDEPAPTAAPADATPSPAVQAPATTAAGDDSPLSAQVREVASSGAKIELMELRLDEAGAIVKQAVYHDDKDAIPEPVRALAEQTYPGSKPYRYETEHYADRGVVYEVEVETAEGQKCEVAASAEGELIYRECQIPAAELPEAVASRVSATIADGKILEAEYKQVEGEADESYSVEIEADAREYYLRIAADGTLLSKHLRVPALVELPIP